MKTSYIIIGAVVLVVLFIVFYIKISIDEKKGVDSDEKKAVRGIVNKLVPKGESYTAAYAIWESLALGGGGRTVITTTSYWYYAVGFRPGEIYIIPLSYEGGDVSYGEAIHLTKDNLGMVNAKAGEGWASFYDKEQKEIVSIIVSASNTKEDKYNPVNIQQKEEYEAFVKFISEFMTEVNTENHVVVTGKIGKPLKKEK